MPKGEKKARYPQLAEEARRLIEDERLTQRDTGQRLGVHQSTIEGWCKRFGWTTQRTGPRGGSGHPCWKGGVIVVKGYRYLYCPDHPHATTHRRVSEHRLVMEASLGRYLDPREVVHHIDGNPANNELSNLVLFSRNAEHLRHELTGKVPNWTPEGRARIHEALRRVNATRPSPSTGGARRCTRSTDRLPL